MKIYAVSNIRSYPYGYRASWVYREFYHGDSGAVVNRYDDPPYQPLPLIHNVRLVPEVFIAGISLVASERVADQLGSFEGVRLNPCVWERMYDLPIDEQHLWDIYHRFSVFTTDYGAWLEAQCFAPPPEFNNLRYFEIMTPRFASVQPHEGPLTEFSLPNPEYKRLSPFRTCEAVHRKYPMLEATPYSLCTEPVYRVLEPYVSDPALFTVREIEIRV